MCANFKPASLDVISTAVANKVATKENRLAPLLRQNSIQLTYI